MAKNSTTFVASFTDAKPTEQQEMLIRMAAHKDGTTRAAVRDALGYGERANIPVQTMLLHLADRFGWTMDTYAAENPYGGTRNIAIYHFVPAKKAAAKAKAKAKAKATAKAPTAAAASKVKRAGRKAA